MIKREGYAWVLLNAHSTGALVAARYLQDGRERSAVQALVLNSPFLDFNELQANGFRIALTKVFGAVCPICYSGSPVSRWVRPQPAQRRTAGLQRLLRPLGLRPLAQAPRRVQGVFRVGPGDCTGAGTCPRRWHLPADPGASFGPIPRGPIEGLEGKYRAAYLVLNVEDMKRDGPELGDKVTWTGGPGRSARPGALRRRRAVALLRRGGLVAAFAARRSADADQMNRNGGPVSAGFSVVTIES